MSQSPSSSFAEIFKALILIGCTKFVINLQVFEICFSFYKKSLLAIKYVAPVNLAERQIHSLAVRFNVLPLEAKIAI